MGCKLDIFSEMILNLGSLIALVVYFRLDLLAIVSRFKEKSNRQFLTKYILALLPALIIGFIFQKLLEDKVQTSTITALAMIIVGLILIIAEKISKTTGTQTSTMSKLENIDEQLTVKSSLVIGFAQALAFIRGVSRSGITISAGMFSGLNRSSAAKFSFLLGIPLLAISIFYEILKFFFQKNNTFTVTNNIVCYSNYSIVHQSLALIICTVISFIAIKYLLKFLQNHTLYIFAIYRIVLGLLVLIIAK
jgi:undecaprenyl-diphosphatase